MEVVLFLFCCWRLFCFCVVVVAVLFLFCCWWLFCFCFVVGGCSVFVLLLVVVLFLFCWWLFCFCFVGGCFVFVLLLVVVLFLFCWWWLFCFCFVAGGCSVFLFFFSNVPSPAPRVVLKIFRHACQITSKQRSKFRQSLVVPGGAADCESTVAAAASAIARQTETSSCVCVDGVESHSAF